MRVALGTIAAALLLTVGNALASPISFHVEPGNTPTNDDAWKAAALGITAGNYHSEENFESYTSGDVVNSLTAGGVTSAITTGGGTGGRIFTSAVFAPNPAGTIN